MSDGPDAVRGSSIRGLALMLFAVSAARVLGLAKAGTSMLVGYVPDDAFYYLEIARRLAATGVVTFDGENLATGFHPLHLLALAAFHRVWPGAEFGHVFLVFGLLAAAMTTLAFALLAKRLESLGLSGLIGLWWVFAGVAVLETHSHLMETPWVVLSGVLAVCALTARSAALAVAVGGFGTLARTDFVLLPVVLVAVWSVPFGGRRWWRASQLAAGAIGAWLAVAGWYRVTNGSWLSSSAAIKWHWGDVLGDATQWVLVFASGAFGGPIVPAVESLWSWAALAVGTTVVAFRGRAERRLVIAMAAVALGYVLAYRRLGGLQCWYVGAFLVPVAVIAAVATHELGRRVAWPQSRGFRGALVAGFLLWVPLQGWFVAARYEGQSELVRQARALDEIVPADEPLGSWNAGILAYFSRRPVINLDGLVNDEVVPDILGGALFDYVDRRGIRWLVDHPNMFEREWLAQRGGYSVAEVTSRVRRVDRPRGGVSVPLFEVVAPPALGPGQSVDFTTAAGRPWAGAGFTEPDRDGVWLGRRSASIPIRVERPAPGSVLAVELEFVSRATRPQSLEATVGRRVRQRFDVPNGLSRHVLTIPTEDLSMVANSPRTWSGRVRLRAADLESVQPFRLWRPGNPGGVALRRLRVLDR